MSGPGARRDHAMAFDAHRSVTVLFGGFDTFDSSTSIWEWEGTAWVERDVIGPVRRSGARLAYDPIRMESLPFGGWYSTNDFSIYLSDTWGWDGQHWVLRSGSGPSSRVDFAMDYDPVNQTILLQGGYDGTVLADTWIWNGIEWTARAPGGPGPRRNRR